MYIFMFSLKKKLNGPLVFHILLVKLTITIAANTTKSTSLRREKNIEEPL